MTHRIPTASTVSLPTTSTETAQTVDYSSEALVSFQSGRGTTGEDPHGLRNLKYALQALEIHFSISAVLIATVGYIVIAAFGEMHIVPYLFFLVIVFLFYKQKKLKHIHSGYLVAILLFCIFYVFLFKVEISHNTYGYKIFSKTSDAIRVIHEDIFYLLRTRYAIIESKKENPVTNP